MEKLIGRLKNKGADNFTWEILCECSKEELNAKEAFFIALFDCCNPDKGYNQKAYDTSISNNQGRKVIDVDSLQVFESTGDCSRFLGVNQGDVVRVCNHQHISIKGHRLQYLDEFEEKGIITRERNVCSRAKTVKCVETGEIFNTVHEAANKMGLNFRLISSVCTGIRKTTGGYHFVYI